MYAYVRAMCGWLDVLRSYFRFSLFSILLYRFLLFRPFFLSFSPILLFLFLLDGHTRRRRVTYLLVLRVLFYFGFLSLVVRTAELDGGCMRLSRDHM